MKKNTIAQPRESAKVSTLSPKLAAKIRKMSKAVHNGLKKSR